MQQLAFDFKHGTGPTLQNFFPGPNREVFEHLRLWVSHATRSPVPTYLWGQSGSGKSHLLRAVAHELLQAGQLLGWLDASVVGATDAHPDWEVMVMDDVEQYSPAQQQTAFSWFVHAFAPPCGRPRWVLAAGAVPPSQLTLREDLRTRLGWGHVFQVQVMTETQHREVFQQHALARGIAIGDDVIEFILRRFGRDMGSLMRLLDQIDRYAAREKRTVTIPLVKSMFENDGFPV